MYTENIEATIIHDEGERDVADVCLGYCDSIMRELMAVGHTIPYVRIGVDNVEGPEQEAWMEWCLGEFPCLSLEDDGMYVDMSYPKGYPYVAIKTVRQAWYNSNINVWADMQELGASPRLAAVFASLSFTEGTYGHDNARGKGILDVFAHYYQHNTNLHRASVQAIRKFEAEGWPIAEVLTDRPLICDYSLGTFGPDPHHPRFIDLYQATIARMCGADPDFLTKRGFRNRIAIYDKIKDIGEDKRMDVYSSVLELYNQGEKDAKVA